MMGRIGLLACVLALCACTGIHRDFTQSFVDANRGLDDDAWAAAYSPEMKLLAVGRDSGRLELWDADKPDARIAVQAHELRTQGFAFGPEDGIVITQSASGNIDIGDIVQLENGPKIWDARSGKLLHAFREPDWLPGAVSATPERGLYLLASSDELRIYDHAKRALAGEPLRLQQDGSVTCIDWDKASGLIAVGTAKGVVLLLRLHRDAAGPRLEIVDRRALHEPGPRSDLLAVMLLDQGTRLVTVQHSPERARALRDGVPPLYRGLQHETVRWNLAGWQREHVYSSTLVGVHQAGFTRGEDWLVLAGVAGGTARIEGRIELVDLRSGVAWRYKANTTHATAVLLPAAREGLVLGSGRATRVKYLDQADDVPWSAPR
ncbi:exported hypothetical protein [uncultured Stenotrophomonas sp.]|uniref:Uncharacterized protein n=1 Tax=uncultured Stenotrophomonas sp. TaxID=165438 RepID=A0A1Y5QBK5_9GAMM|nr:exported hypothetical protein [uncultured Stenotrophomonas sp.]